MAHIRPKVYNLVLLALLIGASMTLGAATGCDSKPATPPPGAPTDTDTPSVDLGTESATPQDTSAPKESTGDPNASPEGAGSPTE